MPKTPAILLPDLWWSMKKVPIGLKNIRKWITFKVVKR